MAGLSFPSHIGSRSTKLLKRGTKVIHKFPSHIGSRSTRNLSRLAGRTRYVSIPHWFSLNDLVLCYCIVLLYSFHPTLVLAQLFALKCVCCTYFNVSIPHWFSLNLSLIWKTTQTKLSFHPTLVLAQLSTRRRGSISSACFHPTLVLAQP